jgi:gluconolactonase
MGNQSKVKGVTVFEYDGRQIEHFDMPESWTSNIYFSGKDRQTLFISASKHIYGLKIRVRDVGSQRTGAAKESQ